MGLLSHLLHLAIAIALVWCAASVLVAALLSTLLRVQQRFEERWEDAERRRLWLEVTR
jgi:hypothetical protein